MRERLVGFAGLVLLVVGVLVGTYDEVSEWWRKVRHAS